MNKDLLLIFTRNPELGRVKTRLAAKIGDSSALKIYKFLVEHTQSITRHLGVAKFVYYSECIHENDTWERSIYNKRQQNGADLGSRMHKAFEEGFRDGFENIIIIGSDMYNMSQQDLELAFESLNDNDYVIGPASDGGYYLLGMNIMKSELFESKNWGTETVLTDTLQDLKGLKLKMLEEKNDVDRLEDIIGIDAFKPFLKNSNEAKEQ